MSELFDVGRGCIDPGITLIEASAGTGKTYAIAGIAVRLIAEKGFAIGEILVVSFTEAATQELRDRIRSRIRDGMRLLKEGRPEEDPALINFEGAEADQVAQAVRRLKAALLAFDEAAIFTIHGFCQRTLRENAFETGALFDVELVTDPVPIWRETAEDFWRKEFYTAEPELGSVIASLHDQGRLSTDALVALLGQVSRHPELVILTGDEGMSLAECKAGLTEALQSIRHEWRQSSEEIGELLRGQDALSVNAKTGYPAAFLETVLTDLAALEKNSPLPPAVFGGLTKLSAAQLAAATKKKKETPQHPFFDRCAELEELLDRFVRLVRMAFREFIQNELPEAKKRRNAITFDDLLNRVYEELKSPGGNALAAGIGRRFRAALVDEFQDTDPVQWEIFARVFGSGDHTLFLIGDPKQAIYGFRGADIFTYMEARSKAQSRFTLGTNWRSDKFLVDGANRLFSQHPEAFVFPELVFQPVEAADRKRENEPWDLGASDLDPRPLQMVCVSDEEGGRLHTAVAKERILKLMTAEINRLLVCGVRRRGSPLEAGDIAVLVRTNLEAESVREALVGSGIPAVVRTDRSVLQTEEAEHLLRLLGAILEPHKNGLVKAALASPLFGFDAAKIDDVDADEDRWQELADQFHQWQEVWNRHGFMRMFREVMHARKVRPRLVGRLDGERIVTNYQHAAECLHAAEYEKALSPSVLLRWLREQNERPEGESESYVIRLEKDEKAIQIVTIHRSKGLQYPVVFCPFNWTNIGGRNRDVIFHDAERGNRLTWDLRDPPAPENKEAFEREQRAEAIRLLYVAVTRAESRCYLFWAETRDSLKASNSALAHIFSCNGDREVPSASAAFNAVGAGDCAAVFGLPDYSDDGRYAVGKVDPGELVARISERELRQGRLIASFSGWTTRVHDVLPDRDTLPKDPPPGAGEANVSAGPSIFTFPKGAKAGTFFHSLLETMDFADVGDLPERVARSLRSFRFDRAYAPVVTAQLKKMLSVPLAGRVKLKDIGWKDRLVESSFYFPLRAVTPRALAAVFGKESLRADFARHLGRLDFQPTAGYMTGFIDLVIRHEGRYYLIDWKSNWLGSTVAHYRGRALADAMTSSYYTLQYHLYTLALNRHLSQTVPGYDYERDFGGVFYLFLRGIDRNDPASGVFYDRPSRALIGNLEDVLTPHED